MGQAEPIQASDKSVKKLWKYKVLESSIKQIKDDLKDCIIKVEDYLNREK